MENIKQCRRLRIRSANSMERGICTICQENVSLIAAPRSIKGRKMLCGHTYHERYQILNSMSIVITIVII